MTSRLRWAAVLAVAIAACTGKTGPAGSVQGTITGTVSTANGRLAGATIDVAPGGFTATTDASGSYSLAVPVGLFTVTASAPGYVPRVLEQQVVIAGGIVEARFVLDVDLGEPVIASAGPDRFQAGFGAQVVLQATAAPPREGLTYRWTQVPGAGPQLDPAELLGADTATLTFTTRTLAELDATTAPDGLPYYAVRKSLGTLGFSEADVARTAYEFEVTIQDGDRLSSDRVVVRSVVSQAGLAVVPVDTVVPLSAADQQDAYAWTCVRQEGGGDVPCEAGVLTGATTRTPTFRAPPQQEGLYTFATSGAPGAPSFQLRAARYIGAREVPQVDTCFSCHVDRHDSWAATKHANYLTRAIDLAEIPGYREECIRCHTTGYNPEAANGGFAEVARRPAISWGFPSAVGDMPPELKALVSVSCESCHGPGSQHRDAGRAGQPPEAIRAAIGKSFAAIDCAQCHATEPYENQGLQWVNSRHSRFISGFRPEANDPALIGTCASCHSSQGFVAWARSGTSSVPALGADITEPQTCSACHDPHGEATFLDDGGAVRPTPRQLRVYGDVTTQVPGLGARGVGPAALCMTCHNSRNGVAAATLATIAGPASQVAPHAPTQTDVLLAKNAALLGGRAYPSSSHTGVPKLCVGCHMAPTPARGTPNHNKVGGHSFSMGTGASANMTACTGCHAGLAEFDRTAYGDYDGNGFVEGVQTEVAGLQALVREQLTLRAAALWPVEVLGDSPTVVSFHGRIRVLKHFDVTNSNPLCDPDAGGEFPADCFAFQVGQIPQVTTSETDFLGAAWNYFLVTNDRSLGVHNTAFAVSVLQRSYQALAGEPVPGATLR